MRKRKKEKVLDIERKRIDKTMSIPNVTIFPKLNQPKNLPSLYVPKSKRASPKSVNNMPDTTALIIILMIDMVDP